MTADPLAWLRTQLDDIERIASATDPGDVEYWVNYAASTFTSDQDPVEIEFLRLVEEPADVLRQVKAHRAIMALHEIVTDRYEFEGQDATARWCATCNEPDYCRTLRHLASVYSHRPGYQEGWAP